MARINHENRAKKQLGDAEDSVGHLAGHLLVMHHLDAAMVHGLLGSEKPLLQAFADADEVIQSETYAEALADPVYVREYAMARAKAHAALASARR